MSPTATVTRDQVIDAIDLYGKCWTAQSPALLGDLFTSDAIYVERAYDKNATFRGLDAIQEYWKYQIVGKQSNIKFRHVADEMVRDADRPIAVVKWLAEFQNRRENRAGATSDKTHKRVRFSQMAKLIFDPDSGKICYLEEYAQACTGPGMKWPGANLDDASTVSDAELWSRVRQDPIEPKTVAMNFVCTHCDESFPSKSQLFKHLRALEKEKQDTNVWICLSVGYVESVDITEKLVFALTSILPEEAAAEVDSLTWAVPPQFSASAVVNVASVKLSKRFIDSTPTDVLLTLLNGHLHVQGVYVHTAAVVDRPCIQERREFEKYEAFIPWAVLQGQEDRDTSTSTTPSLPENCGGWSQAIGHKRIPLEETEAAEFCDPMLAKRLRDGARLLKDGGRDLGHFANESEGEMKIRVRARTMNYPFHQYCRISVSMRQPRPRVVERIIALLVSYGRNLLNDDELTASAMRLLEEESTAQQLTTLFPCLCLLEPALTKYEGKVGISLCTSSAKDGMRMSLDEIERAVIRKTEDKREALSQWVADLMK